MSGWGDKDKLDAARALQAAFFGRSPGSPGSRGRGAMAGGSATGRGRGRGHGSVPPSPGRGLDNSGTSSSSDNNNNNMTPAGHGRGGFGGNNNNMTPAGRGRGGFGGGNNNMTSAGHGRGGFEGNNNNMTSAGRGRGGFEGNNNNMTSAGRGRGGFEGNNNNMTSAGRGRGGFGGNNTARGGGQRHVAPLATSDEFFAVLNKENKTTGHTVGPTAVSSTPGTSSGAAKKTVGMHADTSGGPMELDKPTRPSNTTTNIPNPSRGLMASQWANASVVTGPTQRGTAMGASNSGESMDRHSSTGANQGPSNIARAQSTAGNRAGLSASRWAGSAPPPPPNPSELPPVYRSDNWIKDYHEENKSQATSQGHLPQVGPAGQANGGPRGSNTQPAMHTPQVNGQHNTRPNTQPTLNLSGGGNVVQPAQQPSQTAHRIVGNAGQQLAQSSQPSQSGHGIVGNAGQQSSQSSQPAQQPFQTAHHMVGNAGQQSAQSSQPAQQPSQTAHHIVGNAGQQSAQSSQHSQNPFDDPDFKAFWENHYMRNKD
ncbi:hypothetical protein SLS53_008107 [Cytospora paraplurivora]|uniref:Uncharacterized protein n=1 Tax=Cytospora paraplurivora TaxID=2898453 RepID=A0AAN9TZX5_9PEZI